MRKPDSFIRCAEAEPDEIEVVAGAEEVTVFCGGDYVTEVPLQTWLKMASAHPERDPRAALIGVVSDFLDRPTEYQEAFTE